MQTLSVSIKSKTDFLLDIDIVLETNGGQDHDSTLFFRTINVENVVLSYQYRLHHVATFWNGHVPGAVVACC